MSQRMNTVPKGILTVGLNTVMMPYYNLSLIQIWT